MPTSVKEITIILPQMLFQLSLVGFEAKVPWPLDPPNLQSFLLIQIPTSLKKTDNISIYFITAPNKGTEI